VAPPFRECEFDIMYDEGISKEGDVLDLGVEMDVIEKRGSFYSYKDERLAQGRENAKQALRESPALCFEIENIIRRETGLAELQHAPVSSQSDDLVPAEDDPSAQSPAEQPELESFESDEEVPEAVEA
jgi:recombination protein RecA